MRKVIDASFLRDPLLEDYLRSSAENLAVLTDYSCMESYKGNSLENLRSSLKIVSRYPTQVILLRATPEIVALGSVGDSPEALVDREQTVGFPLFCLGLRMALSGNSGLQSQLREKGRVANEHFRQMRADTARFSHSVLQVADSFDPAAVKQLRKGEKLRAETTEVITRQILLLAGYLVRDHLDVRKMPSARELRSTLLFRCALVGYLLILRWISDGGIQTAARARLANDLVDMALVAYAPFFDGILSGDKKLLDIYEEATFFLREVFVSPAEEKTSQNFD